MIPIYVINLDRSTERLRHISEQVDRAGLRFTRVPAVEGRAVPPDLAGYFAHIADGKEPIIDDGAIGCYASHLKALAEHLARQGGPALILEDDATLCDDFRDSLLSLLPRLPQDWDFVHLSNSPRRAYRPLAALLGRDNRHLVRYSRIPPNTTGYLISQRGAEKFLNPDISRFWAVDTDLRRPWLFGMSCYGVHPRMVAPDMSFKSTIQHGRGKGKEPRRGLPRPTAFSWLNTPLHSPRGLRHNLKALGPAWWARCAMLNAGKRLGLVEAVL